MPNYSNISLTIQVGLSYIPGDFILIYHNTTNYISGQVVSYDSGTGAIVIKPILYVGDTGNICDWTVNLTGVPGTSGSSGTSVVFSGSTSECIIFPLTEI